MHNSRYDNFVFIGSMIAACLSIVLTAILASSFLVY